MRKENLVKVMRVIAILVIGYNLGNVVHNLIIVDYATNYYILFELVGILIVGLLSRFASTGGLIAGGLCFMVGNFLGDTRVFSRVSYNACYLIAFLELYAIIYIGEFGYKKISKGVK